ncbi:NAD(P)-dependent dehydrogenase (short-subunit alcohol dehydrogenase family) [Rhodococcus sp. UYP5]|uniref:SDR family oxidoreductase n=2 Tax=unclassified Rhodococcus (in: high G+C Gram-positive bacteria) TaxID=192944 RepID=UPI003394DE1B
MPGTAEMTAPHERTAVVTGCATGIGAATAAKLAASGVRVIGVDIADADVATMPGVATFIQADLSTRDGVREVADAIDEPIDILVNNAGVAATRPWRQVLAVNALAPRDLTRLLLPKFRESAAVVTTASQAGFAWRTNYARAKAFLAQEDWDQAYAMFDSHPNIQDACYQISKEAAVVNMLATATANRATGLRANTVSPGTVQTPLLADFTEAMGADAIAGARDWSGRHADPGEIADAIVFLSSPSAGWINGVDLPVDGGYGAQIFTLTNPLGDNT